MTYMRGRYYIFTTGESPKDSRVHLWVATSEPRVKDSGWAASYGVDRVAGASLPEAVLDELVVMRYAQLQEENRVEQACAAGPAQARRQCRLRRAVPTVRKADQRRAVDVEGT